MSFLTPLYLLAGLAVTLPILFHLIRRTPRGRQDFSSLMFLQPSPPRVTKRSRIEDWLLLLLRGVAILLLAMAFSRPFWRAQADTSLGDAEARRWTILVDTSASMKREGYWEQAKQHLQQVLEETRPQDLVNVSLFDRQVRPVIQAEEWSSHPAADRVNLVMSRFREIEPVWQPTSLATAVIRAAEQLDDQTDRQLAEQVVIVISDLQQGSGWEGLREFPWPEAVSLRVERVGEGPMHSNATVQAVISDQPVDDVLRLRVSNAADSRQETFRLTGFPATSLEDVGQADDVFVAAESSVYVPPGQSRVIKAPEREQTRTQVDVENSASETAVIPNAGVPRKSADSESITAWVLSGDDDRFDNVCFVTPSNPWQVRILSLGDDVATDPKGVRFFLGPVWPSDSRRTVLIGDVDQTISADQFSKQLAETTAVVISGVVPDKLIVPVRSWIEEGGLVFFVATSAAQAAQLYELGGVSPGEVQEAQLAGYAMVSAPDLRHPVLAPFADPRYSDFTRLKVWKHRDIDLQPFENAKVLLQFDSGRPALAEISRGQGKMFVFSTSWRREDSEFAVWSKFVPLMNGLLEFGGRQPIDRLQFETGEQVTPLMDEAGLFRIVSFTQFAISRNPAAEPASLSAVLRSPTGQTEQVVSGQPFTLAEPGIYLAAPDEARLEKSPQVFAVNLAAEESRTEALNPELLESTGVKLLVAEGSERQTINELRERQLLNHELESRQQVWRWMLVGALLLIMLESALSGRLIRKRILEQG